MKNLAIVGMGASRRHAPWGDYTYDIWGMNHYQKYYPRCDLWFNLHLDSPEFENQITKKDYPFEDALNLLNFSNRYYAINCNLQLSQKHFVSTVDYMLAYAILRDYRHIFLCGCDFDTPLEHRLEQRQSVERWIMFALGRGVRITVPYDSALFADEPLYAYDYYISDNSMSAKKVFKV